MTQDDIDFVHRVLTMQEALGSTIRGIITSQIDPKLGDKREVAHGFKVLLGIIQSHGEKLGVLSKPPEPLKSEVKLDVVTSMLRELRDASRGVCEVAQDTRGFNFDRLFTCAQAIEKSEIAVPSQGLSTTMMSTKELLAQRRNTRA